MNDLRSPLEDRPYRPATRSLNDDTVISTPQYYRSKFGSLRQNRWFPLASVAAAVLIFGGIISYAYQQGSSSGVNATTPIVQASNEDYKEKPKNPGGMDVPFQDAVVFDQLNGAPKTASANTVESLLPDTEKPVDTTTTAATEAPKDQTAATTDTVANKTTDTATTSSTTASTETLAAPTTDPSMTAATMPTDQLPTLKGETEATATPTKTTTNATASAQTPKSNDAIAKKMDEVAPASAPATTKIQSGNYRIQLGAFHDEAAAKTAWSKLQKEFHSQLATVTPDFKRADLGAKGVFYRVQGINLSKATADELCRSINSAKSGSCIVAR